MFFEKILWSSQGFISVPCQPSGRRGIPSGRSSVSNIRPDDEIFPFGHNGKSSRRSSEFKKIPVFQCIRPDDVVIPSGRHSVFDKNYGFCLKTQLWEDGCYRPDNVWSCPDDVLYKVRTCIPSWTVRMSAFMVRTIKLHILKLRAPVQPSRR
jgi:hypothetical protein